MNGGGFYGIFISYVSSMIGVCILHQHGIFYLMLYSKTWFLEVHCLGAKALG